MKAFFFKSLSFCEYRRFLQKINKNMSKLESKIKEICKACMLPIAHKVYLLRSRHTFKRPGFQILKTFASGVKNQEDHVVQSQEPGRPCGPESRTRKTMRSRVKNQEDYEVQSQEPGRP
jgi:hypothetical protein